MKIDNVCVVLLKWDAFEFGQQHSIDILKVMIDWLSGQDLFMLARHDIEELTREQIDEIYWDKHEKPYYRALKVIGSFVLVFGL